MNSAKKQDKQYHSVFSDSTKAGLKTSKRISRKQTAQNWTVETPLEKGK